MSEPKSNPKPDGYRIPTLLWLIAGTPLFFTLSGSTTIWAIPASFILTLILLNIFTLNSRWTKREICLLGALCVVSLAACPQTDRHQLGELLEFENLHGLQERLKDRMRLAESPTLFGRTFVEGHPHVFYAQSQHGQHATLQLGDTAFAGAPLGAGLFRFIVRSASGLPKQSGELRAILTIDDVPYERPLTYHSALHHPRWFCSNHRSAQRGIVSEETDTLFVIDGTKNLTKVKVADGPTDCIIDSHALVSFRHTTGVGIYDLATGKLTQTVDVGAGQAKLAQADDGTVAVALTGLRQGVQLIDGQSFTLKDFIALPAPPEWIAFGRNSDSIMVSSRQTQSLYQLLRTDYGWDIRKMYLGRPVVTMARSLDGSTLYVAITGHSQTGDRLEANHFIEDQLLAIDMETFNVSSTLITAVPASQSRPSGASPMGITVEEDDTLLVAFAGSAEVWRISKNLDGSLERFTLNRDEAPAPHGITTLPDGGWAVSSPSEGSITLFDSQDIHHNARWLGPSTLELASLDPLAYQRRLGERTFYEATRSGRSCQSCHTHADSDYTEHNIGDSDLLPAILSVRGVAHTAPYLRAGDYNRPAHLIDVTEKTFGGYLTTQPDRAKNLEAYILSLPAHAPPWLLQVEPHNEVRIRSGYEAFEKARCSLCHTPPAFTNLSQHPSASLFDDPANPTRTLDTPTLIGVSQSGPYLYDGRAQSLSEVLYDYNAGQRHGAVLTLNPKEREDLLYFLESL